MILILAIVINIVLYLKVVRTAWRQLQTVGFEQRTTDTVAAKNDQRRAKKDLLKTKVMIVILGVFALCWSPYCICILVDTFTNGITSDTIVLKKFLFELGIINSGINWIIYGAMNTDFREAFKHILTCGKLGGDNVSPMSSGNT